VDHGFDCGDQLSGGGLMTDLWQYLFGCHASGQAVVGAAIRAGTAR
jgi:hypothetical protein